MFHLPTIQKLSCHTQHSTVLCRDQTSKSLLVAHNPAAPPAAPCVHELMILFSKNDASVGSLVAPQNDGCMHTVTHEVWCMVCVYSCMIVCVCVCVSLLPRHGVTFPCTTPAIAWRNGASRTEQHFREEISACVGAPPLVALK